MGAVELPQSVLLELPDVWEDAGLPVHSISIHREDISGELDD